MNFETRTLLNLESGNTPRPGGMRLLDIFLVLLLRPSFFLRLGIISRYPLLIEIYGEGPMLKEPVLFLRFLRSVLGTTLLTVGNASGVTLTGATNNVVTNTG